MKPIGDIDNVFGLKVKQDRVHKKLKLSQEKYAKKFLERFGMMDCCPTTYPVIPNTSWKVHKGLVVDFPYS